MAKAGGELSHKIAQEHGAIGIVLFILIPKMMDIIRAMYIPKGHLKVSMVFQRGSVMDMVVYPGDPLTPA